jgi:two-component system phosphate regulon sensor histidine kinase PhoR
VSNSQLKLMAALAGLVVFVVAVSGLVAQRGLKSREIERSARSLEARASLVRELISGSDLESGDYPRFDAIADRAGRAAGVRVTLIDASGVVVGDSDVPLDRLAMLENHRDRPEVRAALSGRVGQDERRSETVGRPLLYLAVPLGDGRDGVVRVAMELSDLESALAGLRNVLIVSGSVGLAAALALSYGLAWFTLRPVREIQRLTAAIADGNLDYRISRRSRDELGAISDAIHRMADQLRERLEQSNREKEQLQAVLNSMVEGVLVVDAEMNVVLANERLAALLGVRASAESLTLMEFSRHVDLEAVLRDAAGTDEAVSRLISVTHPRERTLQVHAIRFPIGPVARLGTVAVLHDMTEVAQLERIRREFVANASHELRTPLTAIQGFSETLLYSEELRDPACRSYVEIIDRHARRLGRLVADLLQLSESEGREVKLELANVGLVALVDRVVTDLGAVFCEKNIEVKQEAKGDPTVWVDTHAVEQIVRNLLDNACQYTEAGGRVKVCVDCDEQWAYLRVSDTGVGIPESDLGRIFERFYRVDKARSRAAGGTGLGLSIVKHLVQRMDGEISVASTPGRGSTFTLKLPRARR